MAVSYKLRIILLFVYVSFYTNASKLNVPRVLLPFKTSISTNYTLEVSDGGCYQWTTSRPEVATVTPILVDDSDKGCSSRATVSAVSTSPSRQSTIILATDEESDTVLKCDVIIDSIHSLEIVTTTRELFLDDAPEAFEVHAKNDQGDTFTSTEGLAFDWQLEHQGSSYTVLRFLTFEASPYDTVASVDYWEKRGLKGNMVLVEGIGTGGAAVNVKLDYLEYKDVKPVSVTLIVVANLMLNPAHDVYVLPECHVQYKVELFKQGRPHLIKMPSDQYYLEVKNTDIVHLDSSLSDVTGLALGSTTIVLNDKNTTNIGAFRQPSAGIHVVTPHHIGFDVRPGSNWVLQATNRYEITVRLYTLDNREIYPSNNIRLKVTFPKKYFKVDYSSENGTFHVVRTKVSGRTKLTGKLVAIVKSDGTEIKVQEEVENDQLVEIYDKISLKPDRVAYPWDPVSKKSYSGRLSINGGSGTYTWKSSDTSVVQIKKDGSFSTLKPGVAQITAFDSNNKLHYDTAEIAVIEVANMDILPSTVEAEVDSQLFLPLAFYGFRDKEKSERIYFEDCSKLEIGVEFVDRRFFVYEKDTATPPYPGACRTLTFTIKYQGYSRIYVTYGSNLKTTAVIAGYKKLAPHHPPSVAVLALGTSREVAFEGGPRAWVLKEDSYYTTLSIEKKSTVGSVLVKDPYRHNPDLHVFRVSCKKIGETDMKLDVGNEVSPTNTMPASEDLMFRTACEHPRKISLKVITKECKSKKAMCPASQDVVKLPVQNYEDVQIETRVIASSGLKLQNVSSLEFEWSVSDPKLGTLTDDKEVLTEINGAKGFRKPVRHYQDFHPRGREGLVTISVKITGYKKQVLEELRITSVGDFKPLSASIDLELVEKLEVDAEKVSVFNHPDNKVLIKILKGSGHFLIEQTDDNLAQVTYNEELSAAEVIPKNNGLLSVSIYDLCACTQISSKIRISGIHTIQVIMPDKVELGKNIEAKVNVLDEEGNVLSVSLFSLINLEPVVGSNIISIKPVSITEQGATFIIHGDALGHTALQFQATSNKKVVSSRQLPVQVFPPFGLYPKNITLLRGAVFQVASTGGPEPRLNIEFSIKNEDIASVSNAGIITASKIGNTRIVGNVICGDSTDTTVYSKDEVNVHVITLNGIKLHIPLTRIKTNSEISIYIVGLNEQENPFSFGTADPPLKFKWIVSNSDIAVLLPTYHKVPIHSKQKNNFAMRLLTKKQGQVTVRVEVSYEGKVFTDEIQLHIFEDLRTKVSNQQGLSILMTPNTETYIKTNRDSIAHMSYQLYAQPAGGLVTIDSGSGKVISSDKTGEAVVQVIATESFGIVQKIALTIMVKPIAYLMVAAETKVHSDASIPLEALPLGLNMKFNIGFYNNVGQKFDAASSVVKHRPSRYDLLQISHGFENNSLIVHAFKPGQTILKVWDASNPRICDYVIVDADSAIIPAVSQLTFGDVVCFSSQILSDNGHPGFWYTTGDRYILEMFQSSGIAIARDVGAATVNYNVSDTLETSMEVVVKPIKSVRIVNNQPNFVTNDINADSHNFTVTLLSDSPPEFHGQSCRSRFSQSENFVINAPFMCDISFTNAESGIEAREVFTISAVYNPAIGHYQCQMKTNPTISSGLRHQLSSLVADIALTVRVKSQGSQQKEIFSDPTHLSFLPQFVAHSDNLVLSRTQTTNNLMITSSKLLSGSITVTSSDLSMIRILPAETNVNNPSILIFPIELVDRDLLLETDTYKKDYYLKIKCSMNQQKVDIPVILKLTGPLDSGKCMPQVQMNTTWLGLFKSLFSTDNFMNWIVTIVAIVVVSSAMLICYQSFYGQNNNAVIHTNAFLTQANVSNSRMSHDPSSPWAGSPTQKSSPNSRPYLYSIDRSSPTEPQLTYRPYSTSFDIRGERTREAYS